jgi:hypothetical protein
MNGQGRGAVILAVIFLVVLIILLLFVLPDLGGMDPGGGPVP